MLPWLFTGLPKGPSFVLSAIYFRFPANVYQQHGVVAGTLCFREQITAI